MASIKSIVFQPLDRAYGERIEAFIREPAETVKLIAGHGIEGDAKAGRHPDRQLNLLSQEWLDGLRSLGYKTGPGAFGEQLIIQGLDFLTLGPGVQLMLGAETCIEITKPRTGCSRLERAQGRSIEHTGGQIGLLARVVVSGKIRVDDPVLVLTRDPRL